MQNIAIIFGLLMIVVGILGFLPDFVPNQKLFSLFRVNSIHNLIHLITGITALVCGLISSFATRWFFVLFGIFYGVMALLGFLQGDRILFGQVAINQADNWLNAVISVASLILGFVYQNGRQFKSDR